MASPSRIRVVLDTDTYNEVDDQFLLVTVPELEQHLAPHSRLGAYLTDIVRNYPRSGNAGGWSKQIWDISARAWLLNPDWVPTESAPSPLLRDDLTWADSTGRREIQIARHVNRDLIFGDFFAKARKAR